MGAKGYMLANSTGTGKTFVALGVLDEEEPRTALIVVSNKRIINPGWMEVVHEHFGMNLINDTKAVPESGNYITNYASMSHGKLSAEIQGILSYSTRRTT